jgi:hypothetical protein
MSAPRPVESTRTLVLTNLGTLALALIFQWPVGSLLWPYWAQSVIIGWFSRQRILALGHFSTAGLEVNNQPVEPTYETQRSTANFFTLHFGFFHFVYMVFLFGLASNLQPLDWLGVAVAAVAFAYNHYASYRSNIAADAEGEPNIGTLMFLPYLRIIPMHLTIIFGGALLQTNASTWAVLLFGVLKTGADVAMHIAEHRILQKGAASQPKP